MIHKTKYGETFDILARRYYGDEKLMHLIVEANQRYRLKFFFDGEYEIEIPEIDKIKLEEDTAPWKR